MIMDSDAVAAAYTLTETKVASLDSYHLSLYLFPLGNRLGRPSKLFIRKGDKQGLPKYANVATKLEAIGKCRGRKTRESRGTEEKRA